MEPSNLYENCTEKAKMAISFAQNQERPERVRARMLRLMGAPYDRRHLKS